MKFDNMHKKIKKIEFKEKELIKDELTLVSDEELSKKIEQYNFEKYVNEYNNMSENLKKRIFHYIESDRNGNLIEKEQFNNNLYDWYG